MFVFLRMENKFPEHFLFSLTNQNIVVFSRKVFCYRQQILINSYKANKCPLEISGKSEYEGSLYCFSAQFSYSVLHNTFQLFSTITCAVTFKCWSCLLKLIRVYYWMKWKQVLSFIQKLRNIDSLICYIKKYNNILQIFVNFLPLWDTNSNLALMT